jgi:hypothetical protein
MKVVNARTMGVEREWFGDVIWVACPARVCFGLQYAWRGMKEKQRDFKLGQSFQKK